MADGTVDLWALDEVHFQQQGSRCRMWVPPETKDPIVYHHPTRKSVGYFAAVRLRDGQFLFRRETGRFNGETFWEFLKVFREVSAVPGRRVLAISDNAQYHRSKLHLEHRPDRGRNAAARSSGAHIRWLVRPCLSPMRRRRDRRAE